MAKFALGQISGVLLARKYAPYFQSRNFNPVSAGCEYDHKFQLSEPKKISGPVHSLEELLAHKKFELWPHLAPAQAHMGPEIRVLARNKKLGA